MTEQEEKKVIVKVAYNYFQEGKWERALSEYKKLIALDPMDFLVHNMMAEIYTRKGEKQEAISEYNKAANLLGATNNLEKAVQAYKQILKLDPENQKAQIKAEEIVNTLIAEADRLARHGSWEEALGICERLYFKFPNQAVLKAKVEEIECLLETQGPQAEPDAQAASEIKSGTVKAKKEQALDTIKNEEVVTNLLAMAEYYENKQAHDEAVEAYITVLRFQPENEKAQYKLKQMYRQIKQRDKLTEVWGRLDSERKKIFDQVKHTGKNKPRGNKESEAAKLLNQAGNENLCGLNGKSVSDMEKLRLHAEAELRFAVQDRREREKQQTSSAAEPEVSVTAEPLVEKREERDRNIQILLTQAQMYVHQNMLIEAMRLAQNILEQDPQNKEVRRILKLIYDKKNL
ncbi:tetratricopeptide repeat protein [bacterium]|nr:tetratricopeptide repeat protein [bacterium]